MRIATIRQLRNETNKLLDWIEHGETVTITRHRKKVAILVPAVQDIDTVVAAPDFRQRHRKHFPSSEMKKHNFTELLMEERDRY